LLIEYFPSLYDFLQEEITQHQALGQLLWIVNKQVQPEVIVYRAGNLRRLFPVA